MPTPEKHALLSASAASRWLKCTAAPRFEEQFPENTSEYAEEGRLAHAICELKVLKKFTVQLTSSAYTRRLNKLKKDPLYTAEMDKTSDVYLEHLVEKAMTYNSTPSVAAEVRVDFSEYVPEGFGTCDCVMIGGDTLNITDYKHGKGVPVSAEGNPQMRLYALGALKRYAPIFGSTIKNVCMTIDQPRIQDEPSTETISVEELRAWGESIKPNAAKAYMGLGEFVPDEHCRFCRGKAQCKARAAVNTALEEFKDCAPQRREKNPHIGQGTLTDEEIGNLLVRGKDLVAWYKDLEEYALGALLGGADIPGWKVVAGRSSRTFTDIDAALTAAMSAGYDKSLLYDFRPKTLTEIEKLMGKSEFADKLGNFVSKPMGKPTLVPMSDKREAYSSAAADFADAARDTNNNMLSGDSEMYQNIATKVLTGEVRLSYANLTAPRTSQNGGAPKYSVTLLIPKTDTATIADINTSMRAAYEEGVSKKWGGARPQPKVLLHDGDGLRPSGLPFSEECKGHWVITASAKNKPQVVGIDNINCELAPNDIYSGMYARVTINFFAYDNSGSKGVGCGLGNVMKTRDGEPLSGGASAVSDFADFGAQSAMSANYATPPQSYGATPFPAAPAPTPPAAPVYQQPTQYAQYAQPTQYAQPAAPQQSGVRINPITGQPM